MWSLDRFSRLLSLFSLGVLPVFHQFPPAIFLQSSWHGVCGLYWAIIQHKDHWSFWVKAG